MRFGLAVPHYDYSVPGAGAASWDTVRHWTQRAEALGFDSVWVSDHLFLDPGKYGASADMCGRLDLGTGAEYRAAGVASGRPGRRIRRLGEAVPIATGMLSSAPFSFEASHYRVRDAWNLPRPVQSPRPPVWVGGRGDRVAGVAGRHADGFRASPRGAGTSCAGPGGDGRAPGGVRGPGGGRGYPWFRPRPVPGGGSVRTRTVRYGGRSTVRSAG